MSFGCSLAGISVSSVYHIKKNENKNVSICYLTLFYSDYYCADDDADADAAVSTTVAVSVT